MIAYHGTGKEEADVIRKVGFLDEYQGKNGSHFGKGIYLATTKKRARLYGREIVVVEINEKSLIEMDGWYKDYMNKCKEAYDSGVPSDKVNGFVGETYKEACLSKGYKGMILTPVMGTGKEIVIYDELILNIGN